MITPGESLQVLAVHQNSPPNSPGGKLFLRDQILECTLADTQRLGRFLNTEEQPERFSGNGVLRYEALNYLVGWHGRDMAPFACSRNLASTAKVSKVFGLSEAVRPRLLAVTELCAPESPS